MPRCFWQQAFFQLLVVRGDCDTISHLLPSIPSTLQGRVCQSQYSHRDSGLHEGLKDHHIQAAVHVGQTDNCLSPVISVLSYKVASELNPDTVFRRENGQFLTREAFGAAVRTALVETGLATKDYISHSYN